MAGAGALRAWLGWVEPPGGLVDGRGAPASWALQSGLPHEACPVSGPGAQLRSSHGRRPSADPVAGRRG